MYSLLWLGSNWQLRQFELAVLHSGETADLGSCLDSDVQTVTALALRQASPVWPFTAMVGLGHRHSRSMFGSSILHSPMATLPFCYAGSREPERQASMDTFLLHLDACLSASGWGRRTIWRFQSESTGHITFIRLTLPFSFYFQNAAIFLPLGMQMLKSRLLTLEST